MQKLIDINGVEIKEGQRIKSQQPSGGIFAPAPAVIGRVVIEHSLAGDDLLLRYQPSGYKNHFSYILLRGKINEVLEDETV
jgi:hypothetical protein